MFEVSRYIPGRDSLCCDTANPYLVAWEAAARLPVPEAISEVARVCGLPFAQASLLVFCELRESQPLEPAF
ncbi:MAG TPA: hypothetical protein VGR90_10220 [Acidimicrobiales bacterium]|nr:hypothetical protein [Acidimicrobiales bacterium]